MLLKMLDKIMKHFTQVSKHFHGYKKKQLLQLISNYSEVEIGLMMIDESFQCSLLDDLLSFYLSRRTTEEGPQFD